MLSDEPSALLQKSFHCSGRIARFHRLARALRQRTVYIGAAAIRIGRVIETQNAACCRDLRGSAKQSAEIRLA